ncbi:unnamed protein product, partial [Amoebophrya sp. A120]
VRHFAPFSSKRTPRAAVFAAGLRASALACPDLAGSASSLAPRLGAPKYAGAAACKCATRADRAAQTKTGRAKTCAHRRGSYGPAGWRFGPGRVCCLLFGRPTCGTDAPWKGFSLDGAPYAWPANLDDPRRYSAGGFFVLQRRARPAGPAS